MVFWRRCGGGADAEMDPDRRMAKHKHKFPAFYVGVLWVVRTTELAELEYAKCFAHFQIFQHSYNWDRCTRRPHILARVFYSLYTETIKMHPCIN